MQQAKRRDTAHALETREPSETRKLRKRTQCERDAQKNVNPIVGTTTTHTGYVCPARQTQPRITKLESEQIRHATSHPPACDNNTSPSRQHDGSRNKKRMAEHKHHSHRQHMHCTAQHTTHHAPRPQRRTHQDTHATIAPHSPKSYQLAQRRDDALNVGGQVQAQVPAGHMSSHPVDDTPRCSRTQPVARLATSSQLIAQHRSHQQ